MKRIVAVVAVVLGLTAMAQARNCVAVRKVVVQEVVQYAQPVLSYFPVQYQPPQQQQLNDELLRRLTEAIERLESRLDGQGAGGLTAESVVANACAKCHSEGKLKGTEFVLLGADGKLAELSIGDKKLIKLRTETLDPKQKMPPNQSLTEAAKKALNQ